MQKFHEKMQNFAKKAKILRKNGNYAKTTKKIAKIHQRRLNFEKYME